MQKDNVEARTLEEARFIIDHNATVRQTATKCGTSKSTVYEDVTKRLPDYHPLLADQVREVLNHNKEEKHIRGGLATKRKYLLLKDN